MPIYIYRGGSPNPQPQNPLVRFLVSAAILAVIIRLGVLLLPVIGAIGCRRRNLSLDLWQSYR